MYGFLLLSYLHMYEVRLAEQIGLSFSIQFDTPLGAVARGARTEPVSPVHLLALALRSASIASAFPTNSSVENSSTHININHSIFPSP